VDKEVIVLTHSLNSREQVRTKITRSAPSRINTESLQIPIPYYWQHNFEVQWATEVMTFASIKYTWKQRSWLLWPTVHVYWLIREYTWGNYREQLHGEDYLLFIFSLSGYYSAVVRLICWYYQMLKQLWIQESVGRKASKTQLALTLRLDERGRLPASHEWWRGCLCSVRQAATKMDFFYPISIWWIKTHISKDRNSCDCLDKGLNDSFKIVSSTFFFKMYLKTGKCDFFEILKRLTGFATKNNAFPF